MNYGIHNIIQSTEGGVDHVIQYCTIMKHVKPKQTVDMIGSCTLSTYPLLLINVVLCSSRDMMNERAHDASWTTCSRELCSNAPRVNSPPTLINSSCIITRCSAFHVSLSTGSMYLYSFYCQQLCQCLRCIIFGLLATIQF